MSGIENDVLLVKNVNFDYTSSPPHAGIVTADGELLIGTTANPNISMVANTLTAGPGVTITNAPGSITIGLSGSGQAIDTITVDSNNAPGTNPVVPDANGNVNIQGIGESTSVSNAINSFGIYSPRTAKYVVDPTQYYGTHQTIASALTAASSGQTIFIRPGTYTENLTLKAGVNLCAFDCDALTPNVTIAGTCTFTAAGTVSISGIRLQTNSAALLAVTGSEISIVNLENCYLNCTNNTGITFSTSSSSALINIIDCKGNLGTTGIGLFTHTSAGTLFIDKSRFLNSGGSSTASTCSAGILNIDYSFFQNPITTSATGAGTWTYTRINTSAQNVTAANLNGGSIILKHCELSSGTASAASIASSACFMEICIINSTNAAALAGAGSLTSTYLVFTNTSNAVTVTTQVGYVSREGIALSTKKPAFLAYQASTATDATGDATVYTLGSTVDLTEVYDQNSDFVPTTGIFTAPYTGKYYLSAGAMVTGGTAITIYALIIASSNRNYRSRVTNGAGAATTSITIPISVLADMDVGDTCTVTVSTTDSGGKIDDVFGDADSWTFFSGNLVC